MKKLNLTFIFGVTMLTFLILLNFLFYDIKLSDFMTEDLLFLSTFSTIIGAIAFGVLWVIGFIIKKWKNPERPKLYNISGALFLIFTFVLYIIVRDIPLKEVEMATFLHISVVCIFLSLIILSWFSKKIVLVFTLGLFLVGFFALLSIYYYNRMLLDLTTGDLLNFSIAGMIVGGVGAFLYWWSSQRALGTIAGAIAESFLLFFAIILYIHTGNVALDEIYMATFISVLTIFSLVVLIPGLFVISLLFNYYEKRGQKWV